METEQLHNEQLHNSKELDQLKSVWVKKHSENQLLVGGTINFFSVVALRKEAEDWLERLSKSHKKVVFNLEPSRPQGTVCVSFMLCLMRAAQKRKVEIEFINMPDELVGVVQLSGLPDILKLNQSAAS